MTGMASTVALSYYYKTTERTRLAASNRIVLQTENKTQKVRLTIDNRANER